MRKDIALGFQLFVEKSFPTQLNYQHKKFLNHFEIEQEYINEPKFLKIQ